MTNTWNWHINGESNINNFLKYVLIMFLQIILSQQTIAFTNKTSTFHIKNKRKNANFVIKTQLK